MIYTKLESISDYVGSYLFRWANFDASSKPVPLSFYRDNDELELSGEKRVNRLIWAEELISDKGYISDYYKASITFKDTQSE